jgi:hypothetical protein
LLAIYFGSPADLLVEIEAVAVLERDQADRTAEQGAAANRCPSAMTLIEIGLHPLGLESL